MRRGHVSGSRAFNSRFGSVGMRWQARDYGDLLGLLPVIDRGCRQSPESTILVGSYELIGGGFSRCFPHPPDQRPVEAQTNLRHPAPHVAHHDCHTVDFPSGSLISPGAYIFLKTTGQGTEIDDSRHTFLTLNPLTPRVTTPNAKAPTHTPRSISRDLFVPGGCLVR